MSSDYNCVSIANFNEGDNDQIIFSVDLFNPLSWGDFAPKWDSIEREKLSIRFKSTTSSTDNSNTWKTDVNVTYDNAGKLMLNVNGIEENCGPNPFPGNGQLAAFVDATGPWANTLRQGDFDLYDAEKDYYYCAPAREILKLKRELTDAIDVVKTYDLVSLNIHAPGWQQQVALHEQIMCGTSGGIVEAIQVKIGDPQVAGSCIVGGKANDIISGKAGWDILDGGYGDDLIHGGNGRDIITGGAGRDELHGDFGWNTYKSEKDGVSDLIAIKSDQYLVNWIYGKAGNNADGSKCDIIEGLDAIDKIKIIGVDTRDITVAANVTAKGLTGIGIYGKGALEALYTGGDLTINQITQMTSGDASAAAMANQVNSYGTW
jgi:hypothetical protein